MTDSAPQYRFWGSQKPRILAAATPRTAGNVATIRVYGPIDSWGGYWGTSAKEVAEALDNLDDSVDTVIVRLNSPGGDAFEGVAIMNLFKAHKAHTVAVVDGLAASAASIIATGADELVMSPGSELMIHDATTFAFGDASEMDKARRMLDSVSNTIAAENAAKAGGTTEGWRALMAEENWYSADEAVAAKLADRSEVVPDAGATETAGTEPPAEPLTETGVENLFDLSLFHYAGRSKAPAPAALADLPHKLPTASADGSTTEGEGGSAVAFSDEQITNLRQKLGVAEDADEATILAALDEALDERAEETPAPAVVANIATPPEGTTLIETEVLDQLRNGAQMGTEARRQQLTEERDRAIDNAIASGRTTPARREHWQKAWDADPEGVKAQLEALAPGLVPIEEHGHGGGGSTVEGTASDAVYDALFPDEKAGV